MLFSVTFIFIQQIKFSTYLTNANICAKICAHKRRRFIMERKDMIKVKVKLDKWKGYKLIKLYNNKYKVSM